MDYILENKEWIFSGIGVFIIGLVITFLFKKKSKKNLQKIKTGKDSYNLQISSKPSFNNVQEIESGDKSTNIQK